MGWPLSRACCAGGMCSRGGIHLFDSEMEEIKSSRPDPHPCFVRHFRIPTPANRAWEIVFEVYFEIKAGIAQQFKLPASASRLESP